MRIFFKSKDGGPDSNVTGYWLIEWKSVFSIVLLRFSKGTREAYHSHAFHALSWIIKGEISEDRWLVRKINTIKPSILPFITTKNNIHRVTGVAESTWALSIRGPWDKQWFEYFDGRKELHTLSTGRVITNIEKLV